MPIPAPLIPIPEKRSTILLDEELMSDKLSPKSAAAFTTGSNSVTFPFTSARRALLFSNKSSLCFINTEVCFVKSSTAVLTLSIVASTFFIVLVTLTIKGKVNKTKIKKATAAIKPANAPYEIDIIYPPLIIPLIKSLALFLPSSNEIVPKFLIYYF